MSRFDLRVLDGIRVMAALVDARSFVRAAEALDMSPSGVSRAIARLESRLGSRLFERTTRSVRLTDDGREFYDQVMPLLAGLEEATAAAAGGVAAVRGRLRVNVDPFFARMVLAPRLGKFIAAHPELQLELAARDQLGDMVADGFDLAIRFGSPPTSSLIARTLAQTRVITAAAPAYLKRHGRPTHPRQLKDDAHHCIQFRDPVSGRPFPWEFHQKRKRIALSLPGRLTVDEAGTLQSLCMAGVGVCQLLALGNQPLLDEGRLIDLFPDWAEEHFPLTACYPSRRHVPAKINALLEFVSDILRE